MQTEKEAKDPRAKKLNVEEIHQLEPKADVYELSPYSKYLIFIKKPKILLSENSLVQQRINAETIFKAMAGLGIKAAVMFLDDEENIPIFYEFK